MQRPDIKLLFLLGLLCMIFALVFELTPLVYGRYGSQLLQSAGLAIVADICFGLVIWRGGTGWRIAAVLFASPTLFLLGDLIRRAPYIFE